MALSSVCWFNIEKNLDTLNSMLLFFDKILIPNQLGIEAGGVFENIIFKISKDKKMIMDIGFCSISTGSKPENGFGSLIDCYEELGIKRQSGEGILVPFYDIIKNINDYPIKCKTIADFLFNKFNHTFADYTKFTYDYIDLTYNLLFFSGKKETYGTKEKSWLEYSKEYHDELVNVNKHIPLVTDIKELRYVEKHTNLNNLNLKYNPEILISSLLISMTNLSLKKFMIKEPKIILELRQSFNEEKEAFINLIREFSIKLHSLLDNNATFNDLYNESNFIVKTEIIPAYENFKIKYENELNKSNMKKFLTFGDKTLGLIFSAFTLDYSGVKINLLDYYKLLKGDIITQILSNPKEKYSNYCYLLNIESKNR